MGLQCSGEMETFEEYLSIKILGRHLLESVIQRGSNVLPLHTCYYMEGWEIFPSVVTNTINHQHEPFI